MDVVFIIWMNVALRPVKMLCGHRQAIQKTPRPFWILEVNAIPKPCHNDGSRFAKTGGNVDDLRMAGCAARKPFGFGAVGPLATGHPLLIVIRRMAGGLLKKAVVVNFDHDVLANFSTNLPNETNESSFI
jgi:hypothetical protein